MQIELIHIVPFDMGISFLNYEGANRYSKEQFVDDLREIVSSDHYEVKEVKEVKEYFCRIILSEQIECRLFEFGIGVFVIKGIPQLNFRDAKNFFQKYDACFAYFKKKMHQKIILEGDSIELKKMFSLMNKIWSLKKEGNQIVRDFSSNKNYKYNGLSYVLTVYHIIDDKIDLKNNTQLDILMNPAFLSNITDENKWDTIINTADNYNIIGFERETYNDTSALIASWSAVAVVEKEKTSFIDFIVDCEVSLQSFWFLFDVLIDNLKYKKFTNVELQRFKGLVVNVSLEIENTIGANISMNEMSCLDIIYKTSGIKTICKKCLLLMDNYISIEEARLSSRRTVYEAMTEILLVSFTIIQIYDPLRNFLKGDLNHDDIVLGIVLLVVLIFSSVIIFRKDR